MKKNRTRPLLTLTLGLLIAIPTAAAAAPPQKTADVCLVNREPNGFALNTLILQDVGRLSPGRSILLKGTYFNYSNQASALHGSAIMASDGTVRLGLFVHSSAIPTQSGVYRNDFTLSGVTDETLAGTLFFDSDGDFIPDSTIVFEVEDCAVVAVP
jgi:hypothetical protein